MQSHHIPSGSNKVVIIICSKEDSHSTDLAAAFRECANADVYLTDYDGRVYRYQSNGKFEGTWVFMHKGEDLLTPLQNRHQSHNSIISEIRDPQNDYCTLSVREGKPPSLRFSASPLPPDRVKNFLQPPWLVNACKGKQVLFAMPPCAFNRVPAYFLHFSSKLTLNDDGPFYTGAGVRGVQGPALDLPALIDAHRTLIDISVCRYIYDNSLRFYGTCHGAQMMWLAMGHILTRNARLKTDETSALLISDPDTNTHHLTYDGVGLTTYNRDKKGKEVGGVRTLQRRSARTLTSEDKPFSYSTDYNHSHMMIIDWSIYDYSLVCETHDLGDSWTKPGLDRPSWNKLRKHRNEIVAYFNISNIFCFQDHPSYHIEEISTPYGENVQVVNIEYKNSRRIIGELIWR